MTICLKNEEILTEMFKGMDPAKAASVSLEMANIGTPIEVLINAMSNANLGAEYDVYYCTFIPGCQWKIGIARLQHNTRSIRAYVAVQDGYVLEERMFFGGCRAIAAAQKWAYDVAKNATKMQWGSCRA